ncbi:MAG: histidinol-phosphate transaminase [Candidatus Micrarchaeota archaeon]
MRKIKARETVRRLSPYVCARDLYKKAEIFMDANENAFGSTAQFEGVDLNRYPDSDLLELRGKLAEYVGGGLTSENVMVGNGSDEIIDLAIRTFAEKGDNIITVEPGYSMFNVCAEISGVKIRAVLVEDDFQPNVDKVLAKIDENTKMIVIISPNSPLGNVVELERIKEIAEKANCVVFVDEAYGEFAGKTLAPLVLEYENLIVSKTLSKAWGLAALRVGYAIANKKIIENLRKIKAPYNVGAIPNYLALKALENKARMENWVNEMMLEKEWLEKQLRNSNLEVFPTVTNFSVFRIPKEFDSKLVSKAIAEKGIVVRDRSSLSLMENCIRVTVGTKSENERFIKALREVIRIWKK